MTLHPLKLATEERKDIMNKATNLNNLINRSLGYRNDMDEELKAWYRKEYRIMNDYILILSTRIARLLGEEEDGE
jgi:hypothetical protein